jgi:hypothetical protein
MFNGTFSLFELLPEKTEDTEEEMPNTTWSIEPQLSKQTPDFI